MMDENRANAICVNESGIVWLTDTLNDSEVEINELSPELIVDADVEAEFGNTDDFWAYLQEYGRQSYSTEEDADNENWNNRLRNGVDGYRPMPCDIETRVFLTDYARSIVLAGAV